jgi:hypothetical protein
MTTSVTPPVDTPRSSSEGLRAECRALIHRLEALRRAGRTGPLAELRRLDRLGEHDVPPEAFWDLVQAAGIPPGARERFWQDIVPMMVTCTHASGARAGRVLRAARVSPARIERWLRLDARDARRELRKLLRHVDAVDWMRLSPLLWFWEQPGGEAMRREFARDFFLERPSAAH